MAKGWVYLAGPMEGHSYENAIKWRDKARSLLADVNITTHSPLRAKEFLKGYVLDREQVDHPFTTPAGITTRDRFDIQRCDVVLMNLLPGEEKVSIGTCIEIGWADAFRKPIILVCKKDGVYDKHPMVTHMVGYKVHSLADGIEIIKGICLSDNQNKFFELENNNG
jgi:nucleoside 2-deoxyribosyltransferase